MFIIKIFTVSMDFKILMKKIHLTWSPRLLSKVCERQKKSRILAKKKIHRPALGLRNLWKSQRLASVFLLLWEFSLGSLPDFPVYEENLPMESRKIPHCKILEHKKITDWVGEIFKLRDEKVAYNNNRIPYVAEFSRDT